MNFSKVNAVRIPKGSAKKSAEVIRDDTKQIWSYILARYVSLGDSIAAGHAINDSWSKNYGVLSQYGQNGRQETFVVPDTYTHRIKNDLTAIYKGRVLTTSFAHSGDTIADLMAKLDHDVVRKAIAKANYVTVCIGANDVLQPAMSRLEEYITTGSLASAEAVIENNLTNINNDSYSASYVSLFNKLSSINPKAKYVFTTIYNPYKYLWLEEDRDGFFKPLLDTIPQMNIDVDEMIEDTFFGGKDLAWFDFSEWEWVAIELELDIDNLIKDGLLHTPIVQQLFDRVNGLCDWSERYVNRLNDILRNKVNAYKAVNPNFYIAETKAAFDTYPDRPASADVHYNDLVNVEFTRGYDTEKMDWGALWRDSYGDDVARYWTNLVFDHISWRNGFPSIDVFDYVSFDLEEFAADLIQQVIEKVVLPNVDPHPEEHGHYVMKGLITKALGYSSIN